MGIADKVSSEVMAWGKLAMVIVVISIILLNFKGITGVTSALNTTIDLFITAMSEPQNWVIIGIIVVIAVAMFALFKKLNTK